MSPSRAFVRALLAAATLSLGGCEFGSASLEAATWGEDGGGKNDFPTDPPILPDGGAPTDASTIDVVADRPLQCVDPAKNPGEGEHRAGEPCLNCHDSNSGSDSVRFTFAGTLYVDAEGTAPSVGATVELIDAKGKAVRLTTRRDGSFWTDFRLTPPVRARGSRCPSAAEMKTPIDSGGGNCNQGGCHSPGLRITLPAP